MGVRERRKRVSVFVGADIIAQIDRLAQSLGRGGVAVCRASIFRAALSAGLPVVRGAYAVGEVQS